MTREQKAKEVEMLVEKFSSTPSFYIADSSALTVEEVNNLRGECFKAGVELKVAKNTLVKRALEEVDGDFEELYETLAGPTSIFFSEVANKPAKVIKNFRKKSEKPILKGAFIESSIYIGDDKVEELSNLKSKEELIGDILTLLQSPAKNVISALQSGGSKLSGILKTLGDRPE